MACVCGSACRTSRATARSAAGRVDGVDIHATNFTPVITYHCTVNGKRLAGSKLARTELRTSDAAGVRRRKKAFVYTPNVSRSGARVI